MSDRRPEKLMKYRPGVDPQGNRYTHVEASPADLLAAVRRGVESGTIEGEVKRDVLEVGDCYLVIPVSDGGSET